MLLAKGFEETLGASEQFLGDLPFLFAKIVEAFGSLAGLLTP